MKTIVRSAVAVVATLSLAAAVLVPTWRQGVSFREVSARHDAEIAAIKKGQQDILARLNAPWFRPLFGADSTVSGLSAIGTLHADDLFMDIDVHDTSMASTGTNKKLTVAQLFGTPASGNLVGWNGVATPITLGTGLSISGSTLNATAGTGTVNSATSGQLAYYAGTGTAVSGLTLGTNLSISGSTLNAAGSGSGTVTSVALTTPAWLAVGGSPVTTSGTLAVTAATGQTANQFVATPNGSTGAVGLRALVPADLPTTGLTITQHVGVIAAPAYASTITFDLSTSDWFAPAALAGNPTLALSNASVGQQFSVVLQQDATGSRTVTFWSGILWPGGTTPTLTTTANKRDIFTFKCISSGVYLGFPAGQNL